MTCPRFVLLVALVLAGPAPAESLAERNELLFSQIEVVHHFGATAVERRGRSLPARTTSGGETRRSPAFR